MLSFKATYTLTSNGGKTTYISKPFKTKEEAKKDLFEELESLEEFEELENMTYCNVIDEAVTTNTSERDNMFIDVLNHLFTPPYNEETGEVEEELDEQRQMSDIEIITQLLEDNGYEVKAIKEKDTCEEFKTIKLKLIKGYRPVNHTDWVDTMSLDEHKQALKADRFPCYLGNTVKKRSELDNL
jgi:hypothetical protein